ncbi:hypothetical protein ACHAXH_005442, partial [Discostella pseudostelligera]
PNPNSHSLAFFVGVAGAVKTALPRPSTSTLVVIGLSLSSSDHLLLWQQATDSSCTSSSTTTLVGGGIQSQVTKEVHNNSGNNGHSLTPTT